LTCIMITILGNASGHQACKAKRCLPELGGGGPGGPLLHLKDTRRRGGTNQAKMQNCALSSWLFCNVQFVASVNILSCVKYSWHTPNVALLRSSPDSSIFFLSLPVECSSPTLARHARAHAHSPLPSLPFHSWPVHQSHPQA
jgi:hypothetical protein